ncbi:cardiolipin synthase [Mycobacterium manitobense]|uniref:phospholipase D n=1 Tax=[Mycobacterium] manitobense TaxID=190147 RepID=A0A9X2YR91_9MYCO|nr:cardiolipin synthase [[Mycobacterium] manitobense]
MPSSNLIVEPDDGLAPVREFISSARERLLVKQFTFTDESLIDAVIDRRAAGVDVRVMLNAKRSGGDRANDDTYERLRAAGVEVQWCNPKFYVTHEKSIVVDGDAALIATFNLCTKYFTRTRDYGIVTTDPNHVAQITEAFHADWNHEDWSPAQNDGLLWSNANSRYRMAQFIDAATHRLDIQHPKYVDAVILDHIAAAADRGVKVHVLCGGRHGISEWDVLDTFASLRTLRRFGVKVRKQKQLRVHAKLLIIDDSQALLGSMNIDRSAFDLRRELGVITSDPEAVARLKQVFDGDWETSHHYEPPDPLEPAHHHEDETHLDFPADAHVDHE